MQGVVVGDMRQIHISEGLEKLHGQVRAAPNTTRPIGDGAGLGLRESNQLRDGFHRKRGSYDKNIGLRATRETSRLERYGHSTAREAQGSQVFSGQPSDCGKLRLRPYPTLCRRSLPVKCRRPVLDPPFKAECLT